MLRIVNNGITIAQRARGTDGDLFLWQTHQQHHGDAIFVVTVHKHIIIYDSVSKLYLFAR